MSKITYTASEATYLSSEGRMVYPGETFDVDSKTPTGSTWLDKDGKPIDEKDRVAKPKKAVAGSNPYAALRLDDLKVLATRRKVPTTGLTPEEIADALHAADTDG